MNRRDFLETVVAFAVAPMVIVSQSEASLFNLMRSVSFSWDGMAAVAKFDPVFRTVACCGGFLVDVFIYDIGEGKRRLLWCRSPMEKLDVDGFNNYLFHMDYLQGDTPGADLARQSVADLFATYWKNPEKVRT